MTARWTEVERDRGRHSATVQLKRLDMTATLKLIGGQGVDVQFAFVRLELLDDEDDLDVAAMESRNRASASAAAMVAALYATVASINEDGNPWELEIGPDRIAAGGVTIREGDLSIVEHYFGVDLVDDYRKLAGSFPEQKRRAKR